MRARDESRQGLALADAAAATHADAGGADLAEPSTAQLRSIGSAPTAALGSAALHSLGPSASAVATLALVNGAHFYTICSLFPYAGFLAVDSGWADDVDSAGYVAGYLATATLLARIPTSVAWGYAADRWGWYPAVQLSLASLAMGSLAFGLARPLWAALLSRIVFLGGLNGWPALTGVVCGEVGGEGGQARVLSRVIGAGPIFGLIGPAVGGWTYNLVPWLPPALPPNLFGAALALVTMLAAHRYLRPQGAHAPDPTPSFGAKTGGARLAPADEGAGLGEAATVISPGPPAADSPDRQPSRTSLSARPSTRLVTWELLLVMLFRAMSGLVMFLVRSFLFSPPSLHPGHTMLGSEGVGPGMGYAAPTLNPPSPLAHCAPLLTRFGTSSRSFASLRAAPAVWSSRTPSWAPYSQPPRSFR
jgi:MFS family permease